MNHFYWEHSAWQVSSFIPLLSKFEPHPFISLQVTMSESNQPPNFLQRCKKLNFFCGLNTTFCVEEPYQKPESESAWDCWDRIHLNWALVDILHTHLCMGMLCASWVPRLLTFDQKRISVTTSEQNLAYFNRHPKGFVRWFETMDETLIHHYTPESREGTKESKNATIVWESYS